MVLAAWPRATLVGIDGSSRRSTNTARRNRSFGVMSGQEKTGNAAIGCASGCGSSSELSHRIVRLQLMTLVWMLVECALALLSAWRARSPVLLAFGADSFRELLSALVVILQFVSWIALSPVRAARFAGVLLIVLAAVVTMSSSVALWQHVQPGTSWVGIGVTVAAVSPCKAACPDGGML